MFDILNQNWLGSLIGIFGIIIGIVVAYYFYRQSRIGTRLVYQTKTLKIIGKDERAIPDDVKIFFGDVPVEKLVKNLIIIWNSGFATFDGENIINDNPLRAEFENHTQVMRVTVLKTTKVENKSNAFINPIKTNEVIFSFDYLDPDDGVVFEIYHTGEKMTPQIKGTVKGLPKGILNWGAIGTAQKAKSIKKIQNPILALIAGLAAILFFFVMGIVFLAFIYATIILILSGISKGDYIPLVFLIVPFFIVYFIYTEYWAERRKFPKSLIIDELEY